MHLSTCLIILFLTMSTQAGYSTQFFLHPNCVGEASGLGRANIPTDGKCYQNKFTGKNEKTFCNSTHIVSRAYTNSNCTSSFKESSSVLGCNKGTLTKCEDTPVWNDAVSLQYSTNCSSNADIIAEYAYRAEKCISAGALSSKITCTSSTWKTSTYLSSDCTGKLYQNSSIPIPPCTSVGFISVGYKCLKGATGGTGTTVLSFSIIIVSLLFNLVL
eukprot:gene7324-11643_t